MLITSPTYFLSEVLCLGRLHLLQDAITLEQVHLGGYQVDLAGWLEVLQLLGPEPGSFQGALVNRLVAQDGCLERGTRLARASYYI